MNPRLVVACTALSLAACGTRDASAAGVAARQQRFFDAAFAIDHPYFPLRPGAGWSYAGVADGVEIREEVEVLDALEVVAGTQCLVMVQQRFAAGEPAEATWQWYAGDETGRLWWFGEQTFDADGIAVPGDGWLAGHDGAEPVGLLPRHPVAGDRYEMHLPSGVEAIVVVGTDGRAAVPAGRFTGCLLVAEEGESSAEGDLILYAPGVGRVLEQERSSRLELVDRR